MKKFKKSRVDPEENVSQTGGQPDIWADEQD